MWNRGIALLSMCSLLIALPGAFADTSPQRNKMVPLPKLPFEIDRRLLPHGRPARSSVRPYEGPMIDVHVHLNTGKRQTSSDLKRVLAGLREVDVEFAVVMPTPNEGRKGRHKVRPPNRKLLKKLGEKAVKLMCCGNYAGQWRKYAYHGSYIKE